MNPEVTSPVPMKDPMGMDYIPVYEDDTQQAPGTVRISPEKIQMIGVKSEQVAARRLDRVIRTVGRVDPVENRSFVITTKVPGWIEKLHVGRTDQMVSRGDKLVELVTDKATFNLPSPRPGKVADIALKEGDEVSVGQTILSLE